MGNKFIMRKSYFSVLSSIIMLFVCFTYSYINAKLRAGLSIISIGFGLLHFFLSKGKFLFEKVIFNVLWMLVVLFMIWRNVDIAYGFYGRMLYFLLPVLFILFMKNETKWIDVSVHLIEIISFIIVLFAIYKSITGTVIDDGNLLIHCWLCIGIGIGKICSSYNKNSKAYILVLAGVSALGLSQKEGPPLAALVSLVGVIYIYCYENINARKKALWIIVDIALLAIIILVFKLTWKELLSHFNNENTNGRLLLYTRAIELFQEVPWFGLGWGGYRANSGISGYEVHNIYLQLLCETGIIGTMVFVFFFVLLILKTIKCIEILKSENLKLYVFWLFFSLFCQLYFLSYGITGHPLYDFNFILYGFCASIVFVVGRKLKNSQALFVP